MKAKAKSATKKARPPVLFDPKLLVRPAIAVGLLLIVYLSFLAVEVGRYHQVPALKKDLRVRQEIIARFPKDYDVTIRTADLVGLGDRFYVAGRNSSFILHAYSIEADTEKDFSANEGKVNYPSLKLFYTKEPGFLSALFSVVPFFNVEQQFAEISLKEYFDFSPIPTEAASMVARPQIRKEYSDQYGFPSTFSLLDFKVFDPDSDGQDEIVTQWLSYAGGSGGTKWSAIIDFVGGKLRISSGYPDFFNVEFSKLLWAVVRYSGLLGRGLRDIDELDKVLPVLKDMGLTDQEAAVLVSPTLSDEQANKVIDHLHSANQMHPDAFVNMADGQRVDLFARHTDDFSQFIRINNDYYFVEAFYILDSSCHWCGHHWRFLSFMYSDGRWISDRVVNGDEFDGKWLGNNRKYTLNDIFGTYPDQGLGGLAFSFLNPDWTQSSRRGISDPFGVEMRLTSPVTKEVRRIHMQEAAQE